MANANPKNYYYCGRCRIDCIFFNQIWFMETTLILGYQLCGDGNVIVQRRKNRWSRTIFVVDFLRDVGEEIRRGDV